MTTVTPTTGGGMAVTLHSVRFGELEISQEAILEFPRGLIGLGGRRYTLIARADSSTFVWLHSLDDPALAIPVTNPWRFFDDYAVDLSDDEAARIGITDPEETSVYVTVRAAESLGDFTANLKAPILVVEDRGFQVINQAPDAPVRAPLFPDARSEDEERAA